MSSTLRDLVVQRTEMKFQSTKKWGLDRREILMATNCWVA